MKLSATHAFNCIVLMVKFGWTSCEDIPPALCVDHSYVCVCLPLRLLITSGMIWTSYDWLNKYYSYNMATVAVIGNGRGLGIDMHR